MSRGSFSHRERVQRDGNPELAFGDDYAVEAVPGLVGFLSEKVTRPGPRTKNTITLFWDAGVWKVSFSDRQAGLKTFVALRTLEGLLEAAEAHYQDSESDWRPDVGTRP